MRPCRSPAARRRWEGAEEGSCERMSRRSGCGDHRTEVMKGERDEMEVEGRDGGGRGMTETSCMELESTMGMGMLVLAA